MAYAALPQKSLSDAASDRSSALIARAEIRKERVLDDSSVSCWNIQKIDDEIKTYMQKKHKNFGKPTTPSTREEQLAQEVANLRKALVYSELRNEALTEVLKIGREQYGIDLLKKVGAKQ